MSEFETLDESGAVPVDDSHAINVDDDLSAIHEEAAAEVKKKKKKSKKKKNNEEEEKNTNTEEAVAAAAAATADPNMDENGNPKTINFDPTINQYLGGWSILLLLIIASTIFIFIFGIGYPHLAVTYPFYFIPSAFIIYHWHRNKKICALDRLVMYYGISFVVGGLIALILDAALTYGLFAVVMDQLWVGEAYW